MSAGEKCEPKKSQEKSMPSSLRYVTMVSGQCTHGVMENSSVLPPRSSVSLSLIIISLSEDTREKSLSILAHFSFVTTFAPGYACSIYGMEPVWSRSEEHTSE